MKSRMPEENILASHDVLRQACCELPNAFSKIVALGMCDFICNMCLRVLCKPGQREGSLLYLKYRVQGAMFPPCHLIPVE